ncbi:MAG: DUF6456 domain-containing protein [Beijerinckiaceae bacterium]
MPKKTSHQEASRPFSRAQDQAPLVRTGADSNPLLWLFRHRDKGGKTHIGPAAFAAGERLRADIAIGQLMQKTTMDWSRSQHVDQSRGAPSLNPAEAMTAARQRVNKAMTFVGAEFSGILIDLCAYDKGLETIELERQWPARSAKLVLRLALDCLARHYGFTDQAQGPTSGRLTVYRDTVGQDKHPATQRQGL